MSTRQQKQIRDLVVNQVADILSKHGFEPETTRIEFHDNSQWLIVRDNSWSTDVVRVVSKHSQSRLLDINLEIYLAERLTDPSNEKFGGRFGNINCIDGTSLAYALRRTHLAHKFPGSKVEFLIKRAAQKIARDVEKGLGWFGERDTVEKLMRLGKNERTRGNIRMALLNPIVAAMQGETP